MRSRIFHNISWSWMKHSTSLQRRRHIVTPGVSPGIRQRKHFEPRKGRKRFIPHFASQVQFLSPAVNPGLAPGATNMPPAVADSLRNSPLVPQTQIQQAPQIRAPGVRSRLSLQTIASKAPFAPRAQADKMSAIHFHLSSSCPQSNVRTTNSNSTGTKGLRSNREFRVDVRRPCAG